MLRTASTKGSSPGTPFLATASAKSRTKGERGEGPWEPYDMKELRVDNCGPVGSLDRFLLELGRVVALNTS